MLVTELSENSVHHPKSSALQHSINGALISRYHLRLRICSSPLAFLEPTKEQQLLPFEPALPTPFLELRTASTNVATAITAADAAVAAGFRPGTATAIWTQPIRAWSKWKREGLLLDSRGSEKGADGVFDAGSGRSSFIGRLG